MPPIARLAVHGQRPAHTAASSRDQPVETGALGAAAGRSAAWHAGRDHRLRRAGEWSGWGRTTPTPPSACPGRQDVTLSARRGSFQPGRT
jgi:hypothetical protein